MYFHTKQNIKQLPSNHIFVFGSNEAGIHGAGAAKSALFHFGAIRYVGEGIQGKSYAIPTKDVEISSLKLEQIATYVSRFVEFVKHNPQYVYVLTEIGCGLACNKTQDIAPLFGDLVGHSNVIFPHAFISEFPEVKWEEYSL